MDAVIALRNVTKSFASVRAVEDVSFSVRPGTITGLLGRNGAGKTTTLRMINRVLLPDTGTIELFGSANDASARDRIGYLPEERGLYRKMKVAPYLMFIAKLKGVPERGLKERVHSAIERIGLKGVEGKRCEELSKGMSQKIQILAAIIHEPDLLILDEPFSGLDPVSTRMLKDLILAENRRGATVLFSTHVMPQAEEICDHVVMIHRGHKVLDDPVRTILRSHDSRALTFEPLDAHVDVAAVRALPEVERCIAANGHYEVALRDGVNATAAMRSVLGVVPAARIELKRRSLEDVFVSIAGTEGGSAREASSKAVAA